METKRINIGYDGRSGASYGTVIRYGDRMFARLLKNGRTVVEVMTDRVESMTDLLAEVRRNTKGERGLMTLYVRNHSCGWSRERPFVLYGAEPATVRCPA